ncbi:STAS domain-containing protein [Pseudactinotalea terrae]|uniref:STAS domain-containing protein n=1 Tax=Pseudactinotalea terrae TaxID=1743262 RepID=UPI0012E26F37|nr:STAS domain-containing protein [Pseudactinotalea terrae]
MDDLHAAEPAKHRSGTVTVLAAGAGARLVLTGEIDLGMNTELRAAVAELDKLEMPVEVHTRDVTYMDSSVMAIIARLAHGSDASVTLVDPPPLVRFLVLVAELDDVVQLVTRLTEPSESLDQLDSRVLQRWHDSCQCSACRAEPMQASAADPA